MVTNRDIVWEDITEKLDELSNKQLTNLITVIRTVQTERESEAIEAATVVG